MADPAVLTTAPVLEGAELDAHNLRVLESMPPADRKRAMQLLAEKLKGEEIRRCTEDGWYFVKHLVKTRDEADKADTSVKRFPDNEGLHEIWSAWADPNESIYAVAKSRQIMLSWLAAAFCIWYGRFHPNRLIVWQSKREMDAIEMVSFGDKRHDDARMEFIEKHLPNYMQARVKYGHGEITWPNGSKVIAIPEGGHQVRSKTPSLIVMDEMAFQEQARLAITAILPTIQKSTKLIAISTPNGKQNAFYQLWAGTTDQ